MRSSQGHVGEPGYDHAELGDLMPIVAAVMLVAVVALWLIDRSAPADGPTPRRGLRITVAVVGVLVALGNLFWVYKVGDSGAKSVWSGKVTAAGFVDGSGDGDDAGTGSTPTPASRNGSAATTTIAIADLAPHSTPADCWVAIDGDVYDLTAFVEQHPGGAQRILDLCGTDGTDAFDGSTQRAQPTDVLAGSRSAPWPDRPAPAAQGQASSSEPWSDSSRTCARWVADTSGASVVKSRDGRR